jgi:PAS domain S-box-containing protein
VGQALESPLAVLWLLDEKTGLLCWAQDWAPGEDLDDLRRVGRRLTLAPGVGLPGIVLQANEPAVIADIAADPNFPRAEMLAAAGMRSVVAAPLISPDGVVGVVEFFFGDGAETPGPRHLDAATMGGRQLAGYLGRLRVEDLLRASEESSASIVQAALDCIITMDHRGRVLDFNPAAEQTFGYEREAVVGKRLADLIVPEPLRAAHEQALGRYVEDRVPRILGQRLELDGMRADGSTFPVELTVTRLGSREPPVFVGFLRDITARREAEAEQSRLLRAALLARAQAEAAEVRTDDARREAEAARAEAERARERTAFLARAGREMAEGSMDWEATLGAVVSSAVPTIADWATLTVADPSGRLRVVAATHVDSELVDVVWEAAQRFPPRRDAAAGPGHVIRTGELEVMTDMTPGTLRSLVEDDEHLSLLQRLDVRHSVVAPLKTPAGVIGALRFVLGDSRGFAGDDIVLITSLAARAALHIQNARLYTELSHIAKTLQASLRPRPLPDIPGVELAARFSPAGDQNEVGGDFYDVFRSGDGVWTAIVGDVSGKGAEAAAITALARHTLRTASMLHDDPAANLAVLNRALNDDSPVVKFCTAFYARVCPGPDGIDLRFANGGHPSPLLLRADGTVESVDSGRGPLVGGIPDARFQEATLTLRPGDLLLIYTDGVTEVRPSDVQYGERELRATLAANAGKPAEEVVAAVQRHALEIQAGEQRDDIALLAIRATVTG